MKTYKLIIAIIFTVSLASCSDFFDTAIELDVPKHESKLAITSLISNTTGIEGGNQVLVSYSIGGLEDSEGPQLINDATLALSYDDITETLLLTSMEGVYAPETPLMLTPNTTYTLDVDVPGYPSVSSTQKYPEPVEIISASITDGTVKVKFDDTVDQDDFYCLKLEFLNDGSWQNMYINPVASTSEYGEILHGSIIFEDGTFDGNEYEIIASYDGYYGSISEIEQYKVKLYHVTEDFYRYDRTYEMARWGNDDPFVEPVILHRNIENGYGIFAMMNETVLEIDVE